jgi:flagellar hook-associated protein 2
MGRIQSSVGLITGIPIEDTVNQLMALATQPKTILSNRNQQLQSEKLAIQQLSSLVLAFKFEAGKLGSTSLFDSKQATSSDTTALTAAVATGGSPAVGNYLFTPVQTATAQQFLSQSFGAAETIGAGSFTFGVGGFVDQGISLNELNQGAGVKRGSIRVTDRSGATAVIDLSFASTVDDVLKAINDNTTINVTAVASGDSFKLTDNTGGSGNLTVQNVGSGITATELGLAGISTSSATATGSDVFALHNLTKLSSLNDGNGVQLRTGNDLNISLADGTILSVDLGSADTLDDVLEALNAADPLKFSAAIAADGSRLELTDLTTGSNPFAVTNVSGSTATDDLGLTAGAVGGTITGRRLVAGLRDTLVHSLRGGQGLGTLGEIDITNRNNVSSIVDLSGAETLGQIIDAINGQATGVTASVNSARNGIQLTDTTGATASNLIVTDGDAENSATKLGIIVNGAVNNVNSGSLGRQQISKATLLSSLNGGGGIKANDIKLTDSTGAVGAVDLNKVGEEAKTIGEIIDKINALTIGVEARINDTGDGILLIDTAGGEGKLKVVDVGNGTTAKDLRIAGESVVKTIEGAPTKVIDGTATVTVTIGAEDTLTDIVTTINALGRGVTASLLNDGTGQRLSLTVDKSGTANALQIDTTGTALSFEEISEARDAKVLFGTVSSVGGGILVSSSSNQFTARLPRSDDRFQ